MAEGASDLHHNVSKKAPIRLPHALSKPITKWIEKQSPATRRLGLALAASDSVKRLWWAVPGAELRGKVQGGHLYTQHIYFANGRILADECTCPAGAYCKHLVAALIAARDGLPVEGVDKQGIDDDYSEADDDEEDWDEMDEDEESEEEEKAPVYSSPDAATLKRELERRLAAETADPKKPDPAPSPPPPPAPTGLAAMIAAEQGRALNKGDLKRVEQIVEMFKQNRDKIPGTDLLHLAGSAPYYYGWGYSSVTVWSRKHPPKNEREAWLYLAHAVREKKLDTQSTIFRTVNWREVAQLITPWQREQEIAEWEKRLARAGMDQADTAPDAPKFRLRLADGGGQIEMQKPGQTEWTYVKATALRQYTQTATHGNSYNGIHVDPVAKRFLTLCPGPSNHPQPFMPAGEPTFATCLEALLRQPLTVDSVVAPNGSPLRHETEPLQWHLSGPYYGAAGNAPLEDAAAEAAADYELSIRTAGGATPPPPLAILRGRPFLYVTPSAVHPLPSHPLQHVAEKLPVRIPAAALETPAGIAVLERMRVALPQRIARRTITVAGQVTVQCSIKRAVGDSADFFRLLATTTFGSSQAPEVWAGNGWLPAQDRTAEPVPVPAGTILRIDRTVQNAAARWIQEAAVEVDYYSRGQALQRRLSGPAQKNFPNDFIEWLDRRPEGVTVELDPDLASLRDGRVSGHVTLDTAPAGLDWFDLQVSLKVSDVELTPDEISILLSAQGRWVRLPDKGWRKLEFHLTEEEHAQLADLGLGVNDLASGEKQRLHVLQLAGAAGTRLLPEARADEVRRRAAELKTKVSPPLPAAITAELRPYQTDGFHFLAYLSTNKFGGILADDMGLGKTLQTLSWLAWLRETGQLTGPALVICPKSVQDNWRSEVARFCPSQPVRVWTHDDAGLIDAPTPPPAKKAARKKTAAAPKPENFLLIINYTQLRLHEDALLAKPWGAVILDEAQYIKNPSSQTSKAACALQAPHRLALSGTPIENRLLDLWSIMQFAMPGVLGGRAAFGKNFNGKDDPFARRRLAARVRPFVIRRTKKEVAKDLPDRIEEEIVCELDGPQAALYRAELKRARTMLLKAKTSQELDKLRFNILTSLLRLRQICCHPALIGAGKPQDESAKLAALLDLLEPLVEEGHKVLVFSQFVEMLELIRTELATRDWPHQILTGATEDRGALVEKFQNTEGACTFLISLKAGGFGLNLTAASYVVLFDPWWNPAVENQAIDRTHRIGQVNKVIAYRLIARDTIEEKIRFLQKQKSALASDILGEETFAKALSLDDFKFLLGDGEPLAV